MAAAIGLRNNFGGLDLRALARTTRDASQARRLLALAEIYDGGSRTDAARVGGVGLQTVRDWVLRFSGRGPELLPLHSVQGVAGTEPGRGHLAVPARQLVVEPDLRILRRHHRPVL